MKVILLIFLLCIIPSFIFAEELVNYLLDEFEHVTIIPDEPVTRPLRQLRFNHPFASALHKEAPVLLTITGIDESLTQKFIDQFTTKGGKKFLASIVQRSGPYLTFIRNEIERRGLPHELIYLPIIESAYSADAVSRSGAMGLWQFMRISIGPHDMKITEWMDERRDFWKSTIGALDKLEKEYKMVGSWELALAAYNAGIGTVLNAMKKHPGADYWELCRLKAFKNETINYVPKLVAVSWILSNPRRYGMETEWPEDPQWTRIPVDRSVDLSLVAEHAGLTGFDLKKANRELTYGITPPDTAYHIKVPAKFAPAIVSVLEDPELTLIKYYFHIIRSGDTLSGISRRYGITESQIRSNNPGLHERSLKVGQQLIIPVLKDTNVTAAAPKQESPQQTTPATPITTQESPVITSAQQSSETGVVFTGTHLVKRGETIWSIARAYNVRPETLAQINNMGLNDVLRVGSTLKTPGMQ
ncbi:MAG: LysM peptidoglycan-binding domain-containing protein [Treponema sp.]|nr:LysM peptidoglycan-binding domain-containing protein [Treponema sp.]